jgi:hypothetical protein
MDKQIRYTVYAICALLSLLSPVTNSDDHLEPEDGILSDDDSNLKYMLIVRKYLVAETGPVDTVGMVCLPSLSPEWSVTLRKVEGNNTWNVELLLAEKQLWKVKGSVGISIIRKRATLDALTAAGIQKSWLAMLQRTKYLEIGRRGLVQDGVAYHFSLFVPGTGVLNGHCRGSGDENDPQSPTDKLVRIGTALRTYAESSDDKKTESKRLILKCVDELDKVLRFPDIPSGNCVDTHL